MDGRKVQIGNVSLYIVKKDYSYLCMWLRKSMYNDKYTFNTFIETIVENLNKNDTTHMDRRNM